MDGWDDAKEAFRVAAELSQVLGAPLEAIVCWPDPLQCYEGYFSIDTETVRAGGEKALQATITEVFGEQPPTNLTACCAGGRRSSSSSRAEPSGLWSWAVAGPVGYWGRSWAR